MSNFFGTISRRILANFSTSTFGKLRFASSSSGSSGSSGGGKTFHFRDIPPVPSLAGSGDTFRTKVARKRVIKDPNIPNFDHIEPLKWANWRMLRDVRRRYVFVQHFPERIMLNNLYKNRLLPNSVKEIAHESCNNLPRDSRFQHLRNRCQITGRSRGILKRYRLSRLCWRNLADYNKLSGVLKASW